VYLVKNQWLSGVEKPVVVKRILPTSPRTKAFVDMFMTEAKLAMHLSHLNIAQIFRLRRSGERLLPVMEYVDGGPASGRW
jgi:eukaryotic-like serine/threonine-protein kinase